MSAYTTSIRVNGYHQLDQHQIEYIEDEFTPKYWINKFGRKNILNYAFDESLDVNEFPIGISFCNTDILITKNLDIIIKNHSKNKVIKAIQDLINKLKEIIKGACFSMGPTNSA